MLEIWLFGDENSLSSPWQGIPGAGGTLGKTATKISYFSISNIIITTIIIIICNRNNKETRSLDTEQQSENIEETTIIPWNKGIKKKIT